MNTTDQEAAMYAEQERLHAKQEAAMYAEQERLHIEQEEAAELAHYI